MNWDTIIQLSLAVLGAASIAGGIVAYRGSTRTGVRAFSGAAIAAGVVMWAFILFTIPVSRTGDGPQEPGVTKVEASAALEDAASY